MINHISFDLDGTLINSIPLMKLSWENVCNNLDLKIGWSVYRNNIGLPFDKICENLNIVNIKSEVEEVYFQFNKENIQYIEPMPGLENCCKWLLNEGIEWSIITSKPKFTALDIMDRFKLNPMALITSDDTLTGKPTTAPAQLLRNKIVEGQRFFYYVGDTLIDHLFSVNSDFKFIEFQFGNDYLFDKNYIDDVNKFVCNEKIVIKDLSEIEKIINNLSLQNNI